HKVADPMIEAVLWYLLTFGDLAVQSLPLHHPDANQTTLKSQAEAWLHEISPGVRLDLQGIREVDLARAGFAFEREGDIPTRFFRSTNVGFGLSYVLPVVVALLAADREGLVILENPEAHLHPRGQTRVAELAARAAASGIQVILETHSDHILDGIRIAVRKGIIPPERTVFHYFERKGARAEITTPQIDSNGRLDFWPEGFFDQHEQNLAALIAPREGQAQ
ncbi:MAG: hypothetical protein ETSY2_26250, partial [Candidatus Entotheonella gemina]